jgi:hypothetical protein
MTRGWFAVEREVLFLRQLCIHGKGQRDHPRPSGTVTLWNGSANPDTVNFGHRGRRKVVAEIDGDRKPYDRTGILGAIPILRRHVKAPLQSTCKWRVEEPLAYSYSTHQREGNNRRALEVAGVANGNAGFVPFRRGYTEKSRNHDIQGIISQLATQWPLRSCKHIPCKS